MINDYLIFKFLSFKYLNILSFKFNIFIFKILHGVASLLYIPVSITVVLHYCWYSNSLVFMAKFTGGHND